MSEEVKESTEVVLPVQVKQEVNKIDKNGIIDKITNLIITAIVSMIVVFAYSHFVLEKKSEIYIIDYVEIINMKKAELMTAFQNGNAQEASVASTQLGELIKNSAAIVEKFSKSTGKPVFNKQLLVTFDGTIDITPMVKESLIKSGAIKEIQAPATK